jgi:hypothetical protein
VWQLRIPALVQRIFVHSPRFLSHGEKIDHFSKETGDITEEKILS